MDPAGDDRSRGISRARAAGRSAIQYPDELAGWLDDARQEHSDRLRFARDRAAWDDATRADQSRRWRVFAPDLRRHELDPALIADGGLVENAGLIFSRTGRPEARGLLCARIFGTVTDEACLCGKYSGPTQAGVACYICGVICEPSSARSRRWGRIALPWPLPHPSRSSAIAAALSWSKDELRAALTGAVQIIDGAPAPWPRRGSPRILGPPAVRAALAAVDPQEAAAFLEAIPVTPARARLLGVDKSGGFRARKDNESYRALVRAAKTLEAFLASGAPPLLLADQGRDLVLASEEVFRVQARAIPREFA